MKRNILLLLLFDAFINKFQSQITPPTPAPNGYINTLMVSDTKEPSVARFQEYSFVPVELYAGKAKVDIPFFELKLDGLTIPISLEYNTQGIQVNSIASRVGTGWVLNAGGNIGKSIKEVNDFHFLSRIFYGSVGTGGMPLDCGGTNGTLGYPLRVGWKYRNSNVCVSTLPMPEPGPNNIDISPDIYSASAPGLQTQFFYPDSELALEDNIDKSETTAPTEVEPTDSKFSSRIKDVSITYPNDPNFPSFFQNIPTNRRKVRDYFDFNITHGGFKYSFNDYDISYTDTPNSFYISEPWGGLDHKELNWDISAWHLNKIENINTNKKVEFIYESVPYYTTSKLVFKYFLDQPQFENYIKPPDYNDVTETNVHIYPKRIKTIVSDEAVIKFQYNHARKDLLGDYALTNIQVLNTNNKLIKEYRLYYNYMNSTASDGFDKRLYLDYVEEVGSDSNTINKYTLTYNDGTLPNSNSTSQNDWYGYYKKNTNGGDRPILYMNTNLKSFSVLPVQLQGIETFSLRGNRSVYPDENDMKVGMLRKITYPTGGYTKLEYEANRFRLNNQEILGGGLRIKRQELSDLNIVRKLNYTYTEQDGLTSGYVNSIPYYGYLASRPTEGYNYDFSNFTHQQKQDFIGGTFLTMVRSLVSTDRTQNTFVGYSNIKEEEEGKGYTIYQYSSPKEYPSIQPSYSYLDSHEEFIINNTSFPSLDIQTNLDARTGKLLRKETYTSTNQLLQKDTYQYNYKVFQQLALNRRRNFPFVSGYYNGYVISSNMLAHRSTLAEKHSWDYPSTSGSIESSENFEYDPDLPLIKKTDFTSGQNIITTKFYYPKDMLALGIQIPEMQQLINQSKNSEVIKTELLKNNIKIEEKAVKYAANQNTNGSLQPVASYQSLNNININSDADKIFSIDRYDTKGHILQTTDKLGTPTTVVWGYNQTLPIVQIVGATYDQISGNISDIVNKSNADIDATSEQLLIDALDIFRKSQPLEYSVTTYTYDPLVGVTTTTLPSGLRTVYSYDNSNKLKEIREQSISGNVLKEFKYNIPIRYYNTEASKAFTKNNCGTNALGNPYVYTVPDNKYVSMISQADADQQAQNDINTNGQNSANNNGTCTPFNCNLSFNSSIGIAGGGSVGVTPTSNYFKVSFGFSSGSNSVNLPWSIGVKVATINGICKPTTEYSSYNGQIYYTIKTNGDIIIKTQGNTPPNNTSYNYELTFPIN